MDQVSAVSKETNFTSLPENQPTPNARMRFGFRFVQFIARTMLKIFFGLKVEGRENVPRSGAFIYASNHKSFIDPPIVGSTTPREIHFAAKKELFSIPLLGSLIAYLNAVPVKRKGFEREALVKLGGALEIGGAFVIFPEGTRFLDDKLHPPKAGVGLMALKYDVPIIPVFISNSASPRRQLIQRKLKVTYGKPFRIADLGELPPGKEAYYTAAQRIMERIAETGGVEPPEIVRETQE